MLFILFFVGLRVFDADEAMGLGCWTKEYNAVYHGIKENRCIFRSMGG